MSLPAEIHQWDMTNFHLGLTGLNSVWFDLVWFDFLYQNWPSFFELMSYDVDGMLSLKRGLVRQRVILWVNQYLGKNLMATQELSYPENLIKE